jgi:Glutaredoxin-like domain (DUF836)
MSVTRLKLYSRGNCHLCEEMLGALMPLLAGKAELDVVDIDGDPGLEREYGIRIPVLKAGDVELSVYRLDEERVERYLAGAE